MDLKASKQNKFIFSFERQSDREGKTERKKKRERTSNCWFTPKIIVAAGAWLNRSQYPGTPSGCPVWAAQAQALQEGSWMRSAAAGIFFKSHLGHQHQQSVA